MARKPRGTTEEQATDQQFSGDQSFVEIVALRSQDKEIELKGRESDLRVYSKRFVKEYGLSKQAGAAGKGMDLALGLLVHVAPRNRLNLLPH